MQSVCSMACNKPFLRLIRASHSKTGYDYFMPTPCGHCRGCLKDYVQSWSDRCTFESQTCDRPSALVTLTYNDDSLPSDKSVHLEDIQNFNKRFRYYLTRSCPTRRVKMYCTSEYGSEDFRPHYHIILFGFDPQNSLDMSALYKAWSSKKNPIGFFTADYLNPARIRYAMKYVNKEFNADYCDDLDKRGLSPLFHTMSNGIGFDWFIQHIDHILAHKGYIVNGVIRPLNRYYQDLFKMIDDTKSPYESIIRARNSVRSRFGIDWKPYDVRHWSEVYFDNPLREQKLAYKEYYNKL